MPRTEESESMLETEAPARSISRPRSIQIIRDASLRAVTGSGRVAEVTVWSVAAQAGGRRPSAARSADAARSPPNAAGPTIAGPVDVPHGTRRA